MADKQSHFQNKQLIFLFAAAVCCIVFRIAVDAGTFEQYYTENLFRVGVIPWSDARGWCDGALMIMQGQNLTGYPAFRPLTPLFLANLLTLTSSDYLAAMSIQTALLIMSIMAALVILRKLKDRLTVLIFAAFLVIWRPGITTSFITEVPGMMVLIVGFALLVRGTQLNSRRDTIAGMFFFGLSQAIRPWNIVTLALLPFMAFRSEKGFKKGLKLWIVYCAFGLLGFSFHPVSAWLFNDPEAVVGNHPKAIYGQVVGGQSWMAYFYDPVIRKVREDKSVKPKELRRIVYRRTWELFKQNPFNVVKASWFSFKTYILKFPNAFGQMRTLPLFFVIYLLLFAGIEYYDTWRRDGTAALKRMKNPLVWLCLLAGGAGMVCCYRWSGVLFFVLGVVFLTRNFRSRAAFFALLYFLGVLASLPLVGDDGHDRIKIGSDILIFFVAALGLTWVLKGFVWRLEEIQERTAVAAGDFYYAGTAWLVAVMGFFVCPGIIKGSAIFSAEPPQVSPVQVAQALHLKQLPLDSEALDRIWNRFPKPSFERYNGKHAYWITRFNLRDVIYDKADRGLAKTSNIMQFWPLTAIDVDRTVLVREFRMAILPKVKPVQLKPLEDKEVLLFGELIAKPRGYLYATGFVLYVSHLAWWDQDGNMHWLRLPR